jgi:hypothetical protein
MAQKTDGAGCGVCAARGKNRPSATRASRVIVEARSVVLCREHAGMVAIHMPKTWEELRAIFIGTLDRRSPIPRRFETDDRRQFPPRPEGRRASYGRRKLDSETA